MTGSGIRIPKRLVASATIGLSIAGGLAWPALADWHTDCRVRIEQREAALDSAVALSGVHSRRAQDQRLALYAARDWCWREHHTWWDDHAHIWVTTHW